MTDESTRYHRQIALPEIGAAGQKTLRNSRVLIVGVGGLGSPASLYLAAAGIGELGLIDDDRVDISNLQRQVLFRTEDQGRRKVDAALENLRALNPDVRLTCFRERFSAGNAEDIAAQYDLVIDGTDNFAAKYLIGDVCRSLGVPLVHGTVTGFEGRVALFHGTSGPCFRCLYPEPPRERIQNCAESGVLGSVAGTIGCLQATEAIKHLLSPVSLAAQPGTPPVALQESASLLIFDAWHLESRKLEFTARAGCPFCKSEFDPNRKEYQTGGTMTCVQESPIPPELSADELAKHPDSVLVDIRETAEWNAGHIDGAVHWPMMRIVSGNQTLDPNQHFILYCHSGARSASTLQFLHQKGVQNVSHLRGGILAWRRHTSQR